jgi:GTP-binding protein
MLRGVVQLLDVRHDPSKDDLQMLDFLANMEIPTIIVATKTDKLSKGAVASRMRELMEQLHLEETQMIPFSAPTGTGRDELANAITELLATATSGDVVSP